MLKQRGGVVGGAHEDRILHWEGERDGGGGRGYTELVA